MKLRKLMIILILIIFLFSIASVTAANTTDVMTSTDDSKMELSQKNDEIISNANKEIINDANTGTFTELYDKFDKIRLRYNKEDVAKPEDMEQYYSKEDIDKYGVVGIEINVIR